MELLQSRKPGSDHITAHHSPDRAREIAIIDNLLDQLHPFRWKAGRGIHNIAGALMTSKPHARRLEHTLLNQKQQACESYYSWLKEHWTELYIPPHTATATAAAAAARVDDGDAPASQECADGSDAGDCGSDTGELQSETESLDSQSDIDGDI